jgi:hypothetical protein
MEQGLRNARLFFDRWGDTIRGSTRGRGVSWRRRATPAGWAATLRQMARHAAGRRPAE